MIVVSEWMDQEAVALLRMRHDTLYAPDLHRDRAALHAALATARAWVVRNQSPVDARALACAPQLRVVGRLGVGLDNLDLNALRAAGIAATFAPGSNAGSVAEYVLGALLHLARRFGDATPHVRVGGWDRQAFMGRELHGLTLGIVGLGDIGARVARRAQAFGMHLLATDPVAHGGTAAVMEFGVTLTTLDDLLARADAITLHAPLTPTTRGLIGERTLALMRPGVLLVNTARGALIDEPALAAALASGHVGGAALDVRVTEPPGDPDPLAAAPNLLLTPHVAGVTREANARSSRHVAEDVLRALAGDRVTTPIPGT